MGGCQSTQQPKNSPQSSQRTEIRNLEIRLDKIERDLKEKILTQAKSKNGMKTPAGPIKSITFRAGTEDDRLRIYWADGSKSDLPCTKEQLIWACG